MSEWLTYSYESYHEMKLIKNLFALPLMMAPGAEALVAPPLVRLW